MIVEDRHRVRDCRGSSHFIVQTRDIRHVPFHVARGFTKLFTVILQIGPSQFRTIDTHICGVQCGWNFRWFRRRKNGWNHRMREQGGCTVGSWRGMTQIRNEYPIHRAAIICAHITQIGNETATLCSDRIHMKVPGREPSNHRFSEATNEPGVASHSPSSSNVNVSDPPLASSNG